MKMKKTLSFLALTMLLSFVGTFSAFAAKITGQEVGKDGVTYKVIKLKVYNQTDVREAEVSIVSTGTPKVGQDKVDILGEVILNVGGKDDQNRDVPQQDITFTVTKIEKVGYGNLNGVKEFNIPASIKEIGEGAFNNAAMEGNTDLKINFAAGSQLETIGDYAFGNCAIKTIKFSNCNKLDLSTGKPFASKGTGENNYLGEVILPNGIKQIGTAFAGIPTLSTLDLSNTSVQELKPGALAGTSIEEVTLPKVIDPTVSTVKIGKGAFPATVKKLTINAPIAAEGAIDPEAFIGMTDLEELILNGELDAEAAIPSNAFPNSSKLNKVEVNGEVKAAGAIAEDAFAKNPNISEVTFSKPVWAGGIGKGAFAGIGQDDCATVNFAALQGAAAVGEEAFKGAGIAELNFNGAIADQGIATHAFQKITCGAPVAFKGNIGNKGIDEYAFEEAYLSSVTFDKYITSKEAIAPYAFTKANITAITFKKSLRAINAIGDYAFFAFTNDKGTTPVVFEDGGVRDANGIGAHAFDKGAVGSLTINGNLKGASSIGEYAFANTPIAEFTLTGEVANTNAIDFAAFAFTTNLAKINLNGNIYTANEGNAIAPGAFFGAGTATANGTELNIGNLKMTDAIAAGAFASAKLNVVNFSRLMAVHAIADNQFGKMGLVWNSRQMAPTDGVSEGTVLREQGEPATIKTVNFNEEFKAWQEAYENASEDFIGNNAFTGTKVTTVNFNAPVSVKNAIKAASAAKGPFAKNGADMKINFKAGVVREGIGAYAFANSQTVEINLDKDAVYEELAFRKNSFKEISWTGESGQHVVVNYTPANNSLADRAFAVQAFYLDPTSVIDVRFKTTKYVLDLYTEENQETDKTPYRVKFVASKLIELVWSPDEKKYVGTFSPENEMYAIDKYQGEFENKPAEDRKEVGVWSAYYDGRTLEGVNVPFSSWPERDHYVADLYINPLRVQNHVYYLNPGHTLIVTANFPGPVEATQVIDEEVFGGVQTFGDYNAWQCNDLRYNPAENKEWGGYLNFRAIQDGNKDWYGNVVRDYQLFRQTDYATEGVDWYNSINLPEAQQYLLVTNDKAQRIKYSSYYDEVDGELVVKPWFTGHDVPWEETVNERIAAAVLAGIIAAGNAATEGYAAGLVDGRAAAEAEILAKLNEELDADNQQDNIDDAIAAIIEEEVEKAAAADEAKTEKIKAAGNALKEAVQAYVAASLAMAYDKGVMDKANNDGDEYYLVEKQNQYTGEWDLITEDTDDYEGDIYDLSELPDGYRQIFPMGFTSIEDGYAQSWESDNPFMPNTYDLGENGEQSGITLFGKSYNGYTISSYEEWLKTLIAEKTGELEDDPEGDNLYDSYKERSNSDYDLDSDPGFQQALEELGVSDDILDVVVDPVSADLKDAADKWQAVKDAYEDLSDEALAYIAATVDERRAIWNDPTTSEELKQELRDFCAALRAADTTQPSGYGFVYDDEVIAEQDAAISDYEEAVANYNAAVATAAREVGLERFAFMLYTAAVMANEPQQYGIGELESMIEDNDGGDEIEWLKVALEGWFDASVAYLEREGRDETYANYITAYNNRKASYAIDKLNKYLEHLQSSWVYDKFDAVRDEIGAPVDAVMAADGETELIAAQPAVAGGLYDQIYNEETGLKAKKDAAVLALINAVNGIEDEDPMPTRLNVIWNDGSDAQVVGIMEAVVNGTVTKDGDNVIYNLNGMRVKNTGKGIFIQNGKKVIK